MVIPQVTDIFAFLYNTEVGMDIARINDEKPDISDLLNIINRRLAANGRCCIGGSFVIRSKTR